MKESDKESKKRKIAEEYWEKYYEIISRPSPKDGTITLDASAYELKEFKDSYMIKLAEID